MPTEGNGEWGRYTDAVIRWRWAILVGTAVVAAVAAAGMRHFEFATNYRIFFGPENPQLAAFEAVQAIYTKNDVLLFAVQPESGSVFTPAVLGAIGELTKKAWQIPYAIRVDSITNFQHTEAAGDDLFVGDLVPSTEDLDAENLERIRRIALSEPLLRDRLIAPDARTTGVAVTVQLPGKKSLEPLEAMAKAREIRDEILGEHPRLHIAITGTVALNNAMVESSLRDLRNLVPFVYVFIVVVMLLLIRSISGTVATVFVVGLSIATAMGLGGWCGFILNPIVVTVPTVIVTIVIADSIHILVIFLRELRHGASKRDALAESLRLNMQPVFLTSLTTAIGFLSLNSSEIPPFRTFGNLATFGVVAAWLYSITFLPAVIAVLPFRAGAARGEVTFGMAALAELVIARRKALLWGMTALVVVLGVFVPRIRLNDRFVEFFDHSIEFRRDSEFAMDNLSGVYQMEFSVRSGESGGISDPDYLQNLDRFVEWLRARPEISHVSTLTDVMKRLNRNMHGDAAAWYRLPRERGLAAQYLLLYEMSLPYGLDLNNQINVDKSATRVIATLGNLDSAELRALKGDAEEWLRSHTPPAMMAEGTGTSVMFSFLSLRNIRSMAWGTLAAIVLISASLAIVFRSLKWGLVSLVPNMIPAVLALGVWGILVAQIGMSAAPFIVTSLGLIVDATVHFLSKYLRARRDRGVGPEDAVRYAFSSVGAALLVTSGILVAGFAVLGQSAFEPNGNLGTLTAMTIGAALVADFLLLPPLLLTLDRDKEVTHARDLVDVGSA